MLEIRNKTVKYDGVVALDDVSLHIAEGERVAVCGPNGSGKSTLLRALLDAACEKSGVAKPYAVFVPQDLPTELEFSMTAHDYVMLGRTRHLSAWRRPSHEDEALVTRAMTAVGLDGASVRRLGAFSGGERRRLALALAFASEAPVLLLDEAMAHLDVNCRAQIYGLLASSGRTIVMSVHEHPLPENFFTRVITLDSGRLVDYRVKCHYLGGIWKK